MASVLFGLLAVQSIVTGVAAFPRCRPVSVSSSETTTAVLPTVTVSTSTDEPPASSTIFNPTTTAPSCAPTTTYFPDICWASIPSQCTILTNAAAPAPLVTLQATACSGAYRYNGVIATGVAGCFAGLGGSQFTATSAYSCLLSADVYCHSSTLPCGPSATPTPVPFNGGFESGDLTGWAEEQNIDNNGNVLISVTSELSHGGEKSFKAEFQDLNGASIRWTQDVKLVPSAQYELSYWWYSANTVASTGTSLALTSPGVSIFMNEQTFAGAPANQWNRASQTFVAGASFANVAFSFGANAGLGTNTVYVDDIALDIVA